MTIEEKAIAYDEAIKKIKYVIEHGVSPVLNKEDLQDIFPELKESEDEMMVKFIKKQLFNIKKTITENYELDTKLTKAIDWLEKQGKQKSIDDLTPQEAMDIAVAKCFEQGEQKPQRMVSAEAKEAMYNKPAWSEEDETIKNNISHIIRQYDKISKRENKPCWYIGDCLLWMQNIKDRVQPQPKKE